jgi:putative SOS response-associated peptidase YedK
LQTFFPIDRSACDVTENFNVAPSQEIIAIVKREGEHWLDKFHWGLVPFWAKDTAIGSRMINARAETVSQKPSFRNAFKQRRCLIIADGFYEWYGEKGQKQPVYITLPANEPMGFAGLWETWDDRGKSDTVYRSCTIITTAASESIRKIHHRMPAVLKPEIYEQWIEPDNQDVEELDRIIERQILTEFEFQPISLRVNAVRNNDPANIKPLAQMQLDLR